GNENAFEIIYDRYKDRLYYFFLRMLGNCTQTANDFLQELFIKIIDNPRAFNPEYKFSTWIFSVANNMCKNEYRKRQSRDFIELESVENRFAHEDSVKLKIKSEEKINRILSEIEKLNEELRTVMILKYKENFNLREIAEIIDIPEGTVKSRLFYARKELSKRLAHLNS
ncbi:MAG: sigma-70 family RNA polymerase sigma factor, partial [Prolixibacteraceae bacterium]|nr:sigma-70 family RNA polymerase sigma factor [Prolixibacteraceae bacterium]